MERFVETRIEKLHVYDSHSTGKEYAKKHELKSRHTYFENLRWLFDISLCCSCQLWLDSLSLIGRNLEESNFKFLAILVSRGIEQMVNHSFGALGACTRSRVAWANLHDSNDWATRFLTSGLWCLISPENALVYFKSNYIFCSSKRVTINYKNSKKYFKKLKNSIL